MRERWFYDEAWKQNVYLLWNVRGDAALQKFIKKRFKLDYEPGKDTWDGRCLQVLTKDNGRAMVIALKKWEGTPRWHSTLSHECFHAAEWILRIRDVPHCEATSEVYAYLTESLIRRCLERLPK